MPSYRTAFISHAHADNVRCARIAALLAAKGIDLWIDLSNLQRGHALPTDITRELVRRQALVLMVTPTADASPWVGDELNKYLAYSLDPAWRMVDGQRRLIIPVRLEPIQLRPDAEESNWAKVFDRFWIDGVGKSDEQVADEIAAALVIMAPPPQSGASVPPPPPARSAGPAPAPVSPTPPAPVPAAPGPDWDEIGAPERLYQLGFRGWRARRSGVAFLLPPLCDVPAGAFLMGSADSDPQGRANEKPQSRIPVGAFAIGGFPVTVAEYARYLNANPGQRDAIPQGKDDDFYGWKQQQTRPDHPVVTVTWFNARDYAAWLAQVTGQPWRLATEAEWEKAARWHAAWQSASIYPWGDEWDKTRANTSDGGPRQTTPVGSYPSGASPYGAQDMAGNVWEWLSSLYNAYPYDRAASEILDIRTDVRVSRGGSWINSSEFARAAYRYGGDPLISYSYGGCRVARGVGAGAS